MTKAAIVFVHLGTNPSPTLVHYSKYAQHYLPQSSLYLITDRPENWGEFEGKIVPYSHIDRTKSFQKFIRKNTELQNISGGYWLYTLERIFALQKVTTYIDATTPILHLESDVASMVDRKIIEVLELKIKDAAIPRVSTKEGVASIVFFKNPIVLTEKLKKLMSILENDESIKNDMILLGEALNQGVFQELPTEPESAWQVPLDSQEGRYLLFDGVGLGPYLFGRDPLHTENRVISGFVDPRMKNDLTQTKWQIKKLKEGYTLNFDYAGESFRVGNLHVHSKEKIPLIAPLSTRWIQS